MTPWYACTPFIPFDIHHHSHPVVIVQRRTWKIAVMLKLWGIRASVHQKHIDPWVRWQRLILAHTLRQYRNRAL